jgi:glycosyltransferase involved in cell wall biosynthesis
MPKVSIITPCFNAAPFIVDTMKSIIGQSFTDWEHVIVDDGSRDDSVAVAGVIADQDERITIVQQPNAGVAAARRRGLESADASSEYLVFLDADDLLDPSFLETLSLHLDAHPDVGVAYCSQVDIDERGQVLREPSIKPRYVRAGRRIRMLEPDEHLTPLDALVSRFEAIPSTCMFRRSAYSNTDGWRKVGVVEDKDMLMQIALVSPVHFVPEHLTQYRHHDAQRHLVEFYRSMRQLHDRWWNDDSLPPDERRAIREAISFDRRVAASLTWRNARDVGRDAGTPEALKNALLSAKQYAQYVSMSARLLIAP